MKVIKGYLDLELLKESETLPKSFVEYLEQEWLELYEAFSNGEEKEEFSLELHGILIGIEKGESLPKGMGEIWLPEYVERISLDGVEIYRTYVMEAEDYGKLFYSIVGSLDEESEAYLKEYAVLSER